MTVNVEFELSLSNQGVGLMAVLIIEHSVVLSSSTCFSVFICLKKKNQKIVDA
jgi:hypothetical protein